MLENQLPVQMILHKNQLLTCHNPPLWASWRWEEDRRVRGGGHFVLAAQHGITIANTPNELKPVLRLIAHDSDLFAMSPRQLVPQPEAVERERRTWALKIRIVKLLL